MSSPAQLEELMNQDAYRKTSSSTAGKVLTGLTGAVAVALTVISVPFVSPALRKHCLPYIPATTEQVKNVLTALQGRQGRVVDLGSGDGRIVLEVARHNLEAHGVELNPWLVAYSKLDAYRQGLGSKVKFFKRDLWKFNLESYDSIVIFGVEQMMGDLEKKIVQECKGNSSVIACRFPLPNLKPRQVIGHGIDRVWVYDKAVS